MLKTNPKYLLRRRLLTDSRRYISNANDDQSIDKFRNQLKDGPQFSDFIAGVVERDDKWTDYSGKLKRESGDNQR